MSPLPILRSLITRRARRRFGRLGVLLAAGAASQAPAASQPPARDVVDVHFHYLGAVATNANLAAMDSAGVGLVVVMGTPVQLRELPSRDHPRQLRALTFPCVGGRLPNMGLPCFADGSDWPSVDSVRTWIREGVVDMLGEINAQYAGVRADDTRLEPYYALAESLDVPVAIHLGIGPPGVAYADQRTPPYKSPGYRGDAGDPMALESVLTRHPRLRVLVSHAAWPQRDAMLYMLYMHPQLMVDVSVLQYAIPRAAYTSYLRDLVEAGFASRILFGSDGSARRVREGIAAIDSMPFLNAEQRRAILGGTAHAWLKR